MHIRPFRYSLIEQEKIDQAFVRVWQHLLLHTADYRSVATAGSERDAYTPAPHAIERRGLTRPPMAVLPDGLGVGGNDGVAVVAAGDLLHPMLKVVLVDLLCGRSLLLVVTRCGCGRLYTESGVGAGVVIDLELFSCTWFPLIKR
jgi:hypothetical protein